MMPDGEISEGLPVGPASRPIDRGERWGNRREGAGTARLASVRAV